MNAHKHFITLALLLFLLAGCGGGHRQETPEMPESPGKAALATELADFVHEDFVGSGQCAICHSDLVDAQDEDISMDAHWRSTMMANAARDPLWQAKVSTEVAKHPALAAVLEDVCATCHMPMARTQALVREASTRVQGVGFLDPANALHAAALDGVSCALCHQIRPGNLGEAASFSGGYEIDTGTVVPERAVFGPFPDPVGGMMTAFIGFEPVHAPHVEQAELCATCHTLYTPYVDAEGTIAGTFPEQTPYLEWLHSDYGQPDTAQPCQACHMPAVQGAAYIANRPLNDQLAPRELFAQHHFVGGNATMLKLLKENAEALGLTAETAHLEATLARTLDQLQGYTAGLRIEEAAREGDTLAVRVAVQNWTGHKFPTGFPSRRAWLHVTVRDGDGAVIFASGAPQAEGRVAGADADADPAAYEPHYQRITQPDQVQIYQSVMQNLEGDVTTTLLRASGYIKDNRLLPQGFDKATADADIAPRGEVAVDPDFAGGGDAVTYAVDVAGRAGPFEVTVELLYQSLSYRFVQSILEVDTPAVEVFGAYYAGLDKTPTTIASASATVE